MQERTKAGRPRSAARGRTGVVRAGSAVFSLSLLAVAGVANGCASSQARTLVELPPLEMPAPPPRVVEATEQQQPPLVALPEQPRTTIRQPAGPAQRSDAPRPAEPVKTEPVPTEAAKPPDEPPKQTPATTLQTTPTQREGEVEVRVRILIQQARNDLNRIDYQALNVNARNQYDTAKRFASQAEESLQSRNLVFASNLADKAAALAAQLAGR
jgi:hypothetical protein